MTPHPSPLRHGLRALARGRGLSLTIFAALTLGAGVGIAFLGMIRRALAYPPACLDALLCGPDPLPDPIRRRTPDQLILAEVQAEGMRSLLWITLALTLVVLAIVVVNILTMVLSRAAQRRREIAMRATLGATPGRLAGEAVAEASLLVVPSAILGTLIGGVGSLLLWHSWPLERPPWVGPGVSAGVTAAVVGGLGLDALVSWLAPLNVTRSRRLYRFLGAGSRATAGPTESWLRQALVVGQVAATVVLLASAGLLLRGFALGPAADGPGYDANNVLTGQVALAGMGVAEPERLAYLYDELLRRVRLAPGVLDSSLATNGAWAGVGPTDHVTTLCAECGIGSLPLQLSRGPARIHAVSPGYFASLGLPLLRGREFARDDLPGTTPVAVVSNSFAIAMFPNGDPLGKDLRIGDDESNWFRIVGVVDDVTAEGLGSGATPFPSLYLSLLQHPPRSAALAVRTAGDPLEMAAGVGTIVATLHPGATFSNAATLQLLLARHRSPLAWFGLLSAVLVVAVVIFATSGLYGVVAHGTARRKREIGIRMAVGAGRETVMRLVVRENLRLAALGVVLGMIPLSGIARMLQLSFRGVTLWDPILYAAIAAVVVAVTLSASYPPARAAASLDPQVALREE